MQFKSLGKLFDLIGNVRKQFNYLRGRLTLMESFNLKFNALKRQFKRLRRLVGLRVLIEDFKSRLNISNMGLILNPIAFVIGASMFYVPDNAQASRPSEASSYMSLFKRVSHMTKVPLPILLGIAKIESGRVTPQGHHPWPWAVNIAGHSHYFNTHREALASIRKGLKQGINNIDIGVMQLNWKYHYQNFVTCEKMIHPFHNILYAARFLKQLRTQYGTWAQAVAAYHSRNKNRGQAYMIKVATMINPRKTVKHSPTVTSHITKRRT